MSSHRIDKVERLIKEEISLIFLHKMQDAASIMSFCMITAPSCNGDVGLNIDINSGLVTSAFRGLPASLYILNPVSR